MPGCIAGGIAAGYSLSEASRETSGFSCQGAQLDNGYHLLPPGKIAAVVTYLEMRADPGHAPTPLPPDMAIRRVERPSLDWYRALYRAVGEDWMWFSRLSMPDEALTSILHDPANEVYVLTRGSAEIGLLELDFRAHPDCELAFLGLTTDAIGQGAGRALMQFATDRAWSRTPQIKRFFVHTCTLDHHGALAFYMRSGFTPYGRAIEIADDPRLDGRLPQSAAPWQPLI